jgi:hypothetical protein
MRAGASHQSNPLRLTTKLEEKIKSLEEKLADNSRFKKLEDKMNALYAKADELAIRFAGLGFRGQAEANAWLSMHIPSHDFGWILDPHIVMEHIHYAVTAKDTLKRLEGIYKLKLSTIAQGLAVSSFENKVPKLFSKASTYKVIKDDSSYFDAIPSFADWDEKDNGWRDKLEAELVSLQSSMEDGISLQFGAGTPTYHLVSLSVTRSVGWIRGLKDFMDEYYKELTRGKFGTKKSLARHYQARQTTTRQGGRAASRRREDSSRWRFGANCSNYLLGVLALSRYHGAYTGQSL